MYKLTIVTFFFLITALNTHAQYVTIWKTNNPGTSASNRITIPAVGTNYTIHWEEVGNPSRSGTSIGSGRYTLTFPAAGTYQVSITKGTGTFESIAFNLGGDRRKLLKITKWGDTQWKTMIGAYQGCSNLTITATDIPDLREVTNMTNMFENCTSLTDIPGVNDWDVSQVTSTAGMFYGASSFNKPIDQWDVSNVDNMSYMFGGARAFNQPIGNWDVSNVATMLQMFTVATTFNQPLNDWDVSKVTDMTQMFLGASAFNQPLNDWNVSNVTDMNQMFNDAKAFNQPLGKWNVSNVTNMTGMFFVAGAFNQPLGTWNVGNVTNMEGMFYGVSTFNQSLGAWNLSKVTNMSGMLSNSGIDCKNLTFTLQGWANNLLTPDKITFDAARRDYGSQAAAALLALRDTKKWKITIGNQIECTALEVSLISFEVRNEAGQVNLKWATASETDNDYFEIQRSDNAHQWIDLTRVKGAGTVKSIQKYTATDLNLLPGTYYYRLKIVDLAGKADYSTIRSVYIENPQTQYIFPNPAISSVTFAGLPQGLLKIYDVLGRVVLKTEIKSETTEIIIAELPVGMYTAKMENGWTSRFIKR